MPIALLLLVALGAAPEPNPNAIAINLGLGSAVGYVGLTYARTVVPRLELEAGVGYGYTGTQLSLMPKLALGRGSEHFVLGVGPSFGTPGTIVDGVRRAVPWINVDAGYEHRGADGFFFLFAMGTATCLAPWLQKALSEDFGPDRVHSPGDTTFQTRIALGVAF